MNGIKGLPSSRLYQRCDLSQLDFTNSAELAPLTEILGQERAVEAIEFGVNIRHEGYNLYLMGSTGLGKHRVINQALEKHRAQAPPPRDWCYIANFEDPHCPYALSLPPGRGQALREDMQQLVEDLLNALPTAFQSMEYNRRADAINTEFKGREDEAAEQLGRKARELGIALIHTPGGYTLAPIRDGHILNNEEFEALPPGEQEAVQQVLEQLKKELKDSMNHVPIWQRERRKRFKALDRETAASTINQLMADLEEHYKDLPAVLDYLANVKQDVVDKLDLFRQTEGADGQTASPDDMQFNRYKVNLLVDNANSSGSPVVYEDNPTYMNLIGRVEHLSRLGALVTDFTLIKPGALHHANGGFLILDSAKVLTSPFAWDALKRVLKAREIRIEALEKLLSLAGTMSLEPQVIPLDIKVVLIGDRLLYFLLSTYDPEFGQLFKVAADFSEYMPRLTGNDQLYARFIATLQQRDKLRPLDKAALERVVEQAARWASDSEQLSLDVSVLLNLLKESDFHAQRGDSPLIRAEHVDAALDAQVRRVNQLHIRMQEQILRGTVLIDTKGMQLGQVNGLSVFISGEHAFGLPTRISATARLGSGELVDIQREVDQGGPIHSKGVFILASYLARRYARNQPLCLSASLAFEQTYGQIEGDSASTAELCALLSAIGDIPLKQSLAITGSINQHGEVQAIGGVNEKIEGFFDICQDRGLSGEHGVIIPHSNCHHLMLRRDVVEAVASGAFHIYSVSHADQALQLLTGQSAGAPNADGVFPLQSVNGQVQLKLAEWFALRQQLATGVER